MHTDVICYSDARVAYCVEFLGPVRPLASYLPKGFRGPPNPARSRLRLSRNRYSAGLAGGGTDAFG